MRPPDAFAVIDFGPVGVQGGKRPRPRSVFAGIGLQQRYVHEVLRAPGRALVREEVRSSQIGNRPSIENLFDTAVPRSVELDSGDACQQVDATRGQAELNDGSRAEEIVAGDAQRFDRRTEFVQRMPCTTRVRVVTFDPDIEISGRAGNAVDGQRMCTDHDEPCPGVVQRDQQIAEVVVQSAESLRVGRMIRIGMRWRG